MIYNAVNPSHCCSGVWDLGTRVLNYRFKAFDRAIGEGSGIRGSNRRQQLDELWKSTDKDQDLATLVA